MTTTTLRIASPDIVGKSAEDFHRLFLANREDVFVGAIYNSGLYGAIYRKTPKSDRGRIGKVGGKMQLVKSILPGGPSDTKMAKVPKTYTQYTLSYVIGSNKPFARYVEEGKPPMPAEGVYWDRVTKGSASRGWTTPGTGPHFLENSMKEYNDKVVKALAMNIDAIWRMTR